MRINARDLESPAAPHGGRAFWCTGPVARAYVVPSESGWAARQILAAALERLGYGTDFYGSGDDWVVLLR